jgi:dihydrofolate synthase / folylpolyglutamate synthase
LTRDPLDWLLGLEHLGMKFGLENMQRLTAALDHPEARFASIHIAGTNGKGSVTAMVDTGLRAAGYRSARYTSPHLQRLEERYVLNGAETSRDALRQAVSRVRSAVERLSAEDAAFSPTFFECATAAAFVLFAQSAVEIAVLEVGLGGRLDATNVVHPIVTAITSIDFDHQALLGDTLAAIAAEKAGILKPGVPVVVGELPAEADEVVRLTADRLGAPMHPAPHTWRMRFDGVRPALRGRHQLGNIAVAVGVLDALASNGMSVGDDAIRSAIERVVWPARLEHIKKGRTELLLDAAHNPAGARALAAYVREIGWSDAVLVFGAMKDKDVTGMLAALAPVVRTIVCTTAPTDRAETAARLASLAGKHNAQALVEPDPETAVERARALSPRVIVAGSIFLIGALRGILR